MSVASPIIETPNEKVEVEVEAEAGAGFYRNGPNIVSIEHNISGGASGSFPPRTPLSKRKTKRKEDGPLEIVCGWIVEHQIGMMKVPRIQSRPLANGIQDWL